jgi:hypothetical protein
MRHTRPAVGVCDLRRGWLLLTLATSRRAVSTLVVGQFLPEYAVSAV